MSRRKISYASCEGDDLADPLGSRPHKFNAPGDLFKAVDAFVAVVQPAYGINFTAFSKTRPIRWDVVMPAKGETPNPDALCKASDEVRAKLVAAIPKQAYEVPKKRRKLLVIESLHGMSHNTIPHTNVMLEEMGRITGAWEAEFNNDLDNLKYPKILTNRRGGSAPGAGG